MRFQAEVIGGVSSCFVAEFFSPFVSRALFTWLLQKGSLLTQDLESKRTKLLGLSKSAVGNNTFLMVKAVIGLAEF